MQESFLRWPGSVHDPPDEKPRTDALRNRERILEVAKEAFTRSGANASLDDIARQAGVGAGTLYRQFPTRDALLEAVYRTEVEKLPVACQHQHKREPKSSVWREPVKRASSAETR